MKTINATLALLLFVFAIGCSSDDPVSPPVTPTASQIGILE